MRRLVSWFDDKFHHEVTSNLLYERVNKKVSGQGFPDSKNIKEGARKIKYHLDYMAWLLEHRRWLAGDTMTLADFAAAAHLSSLDYISDVDWNRSSVVKDWYAKIKSRPAFRNIYPIRCLGSHRPAITMIWISDVRMGLGVTVSLKQAIIDQARAEGFSLCRFTHQTAFRMFQTSYQILSTRGITDKCHGWRIAKHGGQIRVRCGLMRKQLSCWAKVMHQNMIPRTS